VADPSEYYPAYPFGAGDLSEMLEEEETPAKRRRTDGDAGPSGRNRSGKRSKYSRSLPPKKYPLLRLTFKHYLRDNEVEKSRLLYASLSDSTWGRYEAALKMFKCFLHQNDTEVFWPMNEEEQTKFIIWLGGRVNLGGNTSEAYFRSIRSIQVLMGFSPFLPKQGEKRIKALIQGLKNIKGPGSAKRKQAVTTEMLKKLRNRIINAGWTGGTKKAFWTCCLMAFFGSFRVGELLKSNTNNRGLIWDDIEDDGKQFVKIKIAEPKTRGGAQWVNLFPLKARLYCPVRALRHLKQTAQDKNQLGPQSNVFSETFTYQKFYQLLKQITRGDPNLKISPNSFRAGIPSLIEANPQIGADRNVKIWGRWKSNAYESYMRSNSSNKYWIFKKLEPVLNSAFNS